MDWTGLPLIPVFYTDYPILIRTLHVPRKVPPLYSLFFQQFGLKCKWKEQVVKLETIGESSTLPPGKISD